MKDLTGFLLARFDEDQADAEQLASDLGRWHRERERNGADGTQGSIIAATLEGSAFDPARVLADIEAKRRIVTRLAYRLSMQAAGATDPFDWDDLTRHYYEACRDLAVPYAGHRDWREEWRP